MKVELTDKEMEYLQDKVFWDWKRSEIDTEFYSVLVDNPKGVRRMKKVDKWYKNLYQKLGGELWRK